MEISDYALQLEDQHAGQRSEPARSSRGRKPFVLSEKAERGLIRVFDYTTVPFNTLAKAVEQARGPG